MDIPLSLNLIPLLLVIAAIFAASEASLFSLSRTQLEAIRMEKPALYRRIRALVQKPEGLLSTLIIGNETVNILIGTLVVTLLETKFEGLTDRSVIFLSVFICSLLGLICSEVLPKIIAFRLPILTASILVYPASWAHYLFTPARRVFLYITRRILHLLNIRTTSQTALSEKDLLTLIDVGAESGSLDIDEQQLIKNVFQFTDRPVSSVMTPWDKVFTIQESMGIEEVLNAVRQKTYSRIPVLAKEGNRIIGILYTKELLRLLLAPTLQSQADALSRAIFPPYIVSSHKTVSRLFREFKAKKMHIALIVDEFGRQTGIATLEDLLNALFQTRKGGAE